MADMFKTQIKDAFVQSCDEMLPMFGLLPSFESETTAESLESSCQVSILVGLANGIKGNVIVGTDKPAALRIVSSMMGGMDVSEFDEMAGSTLRELANMLVGSTVAKLQYNMPIELSPPTLAVGDEIFLMISQVPSTKLNFKIGEDTLCITFCVE